ncbi:dissimilatory sulfite reductase D family protein [Ammonifex thiophilus]|uniref:Sulfite reductase n=1 Tax=Ammonifex thiophilus TaxID=444093 RepID=A0A3D8P871_9THEO|nr:dissimilatory sulfite reductase D family protein [Ammonifex thiophilus]RDV84629.1 sulfite reductase [Ammonifex thiophilus]
MLEDIKNAIVEYLTNAKKSKHYFKDIEKAVKQKFPNASARDIKKACTELVNEDKVAYFSTGSTTMYCLKGREAETTDME